MRKITPEELAEILVKHRLWLMGDGGERADLSDAIEDWAKWLPESPEIKRMHSEAPAFWARHKDLILSICK